MKWSPKQYLGWILNPVYACCIWRWLQRQMMFPKSHSSFGNLYLTKLTTLWPYRLSTFILLHKYFFFCFICCIDSFSHPFSSLPTPERRAVNNLAACVPLSGICHGGFWHWDLFTRLVFSGFPQVSSQRKAGWFIFLNILIIACLLRYLMK